MNSRIDFLKFGRALISFTQGYGHPRLGRKVFEARGLNPVDYDLCICKSPNGFRTFFQDIAARIVPVDAPGSTSANLKSIPYRQVPRPIFPLDSDVTADLNAELKP